ncbi:MAG TPA: MobQ family relaxase, partial [Gammaproteobacteria bacterium]|nr:MobQ family relaxase [Gammaproteobacteria bacterium]
MAIYHLPVKMIKRSAGQSAVASAAYRRATILRDERTGLVHNFSHKTNVIYSEIFAPDNAPAWMMEICELQKTDPSRASEALWNSVEKREKRVDSQLAREFEFALPLELNKNECIALTKAYVKTLTDQGMVVDVSIHWDKGNPHAHVMASTRFLETQGWGKKNCEWNKKSALRGWRENLATLTNQFLEKNGFHPRISHLSYAEQGIDLEPTVHEGSANSRANKNARAENKKIRLRNLNKIIENPIILLEKLALQNTTFSIADITSALGIYLEPANADFLGSNSPKPKSGRLPFQTLNIIQTAVAPQFFAASNPANT